MPNSSRIIRDMSHFNGLEVLKAVLTIGKSITPCTGIELDVSPVPVFLRL